MAKRESTFGNMLVTLLVITLISGSTLGYVHELTKGPRAIADQAKQTLAIRKVVPTFDNDPNAMVYEIPTIDGTGNLQCYPATFGDELVGTAIRTFTTTGFSGYIWLMVGLLPDGTIHDISVLDQKETPGLGTKIVEPAFKDQYKGKHPESFNMAVKKDGGEVDAITAATISSRAFSDAVKRATDAYKKGGKNESME